MQTLAPGSSGEAVRALQTRLIQLGFLAGSADGAFGPLTAQALRDLQRRLSLRPDGVAGPLTLAALAAPLPLPTSAYGPLRRQAEALAGQGRADDEHLPLLDRGLAASPLRSEPPRYAARLALASPAAELLPYPASPAGFAAYPERGVLPALLSGRDGRGGLECLSEAVSQACVCVGSFAADQPLKLRWYGRRPLDNVQFWSATKFIAPLHVLCQANRRSPGTPVGPLRVRSGDGVQAARFAELFRDMVSYARDAQVPGSSNAIGYLFKQLRNPGEPDVQTWLRQLSGNAELRFLGRYGSEALFAQALLQGPEGVLVGHGPLPRTRNLISAYDLVRLLTMLGWHHQLTADQRLPGAQWTSLAAVVEGLGHDTARYIDAALERLGLLEAVAEPVILSKMGFGAETADPGIDALSYAAFASFRDRRVRPQRQRCFALALRVPTRPGAGLDADARMGAEVTELVRRLFAEELA